MAQLSSIAAIGDVMSRTPTCTTNKAASAIRKKLGEATIRHSDESPNESGYPDGIADRAVPPESMGDIRYGLSLRSIISPTTEGFALPLLSFIT